MAQTNRTDMAFQQYFMQEWESIPKQSAESEKTSPCFDCSICLDFARDPVVTLCGHLYCWPCIYKWFDSQATEEHPQCPVCKAEISEKTMVPLYGRGQSLSESEPEVIPPRPAACGIKGLSELLNPEQQLVSRNPYHDLRNFEEGEESSHQLFNVGEGAAMSVSHPTVGMFGEMVYARVFGNSQSLYTYPNSYNSAVSRTPRLRRQELQANTSLHRVTVFLFCFFLLCLLVF